MNKRIYLLLMFVLAFFIFCGSVGAAKELTCVYGEKNDKYMLIQRSNGEYNLQHSHSNDDDWELFDAKYKLSLNNGDELSSTNQLDSCPIFVLVGQNPSNLEKDYSFKFYDVEESYDSYSYNRYDLIDSDDKAYDIQIDGNQFYFQYNNLYKETAIAEKKGWSAECSYRDSVNNSEVFLYFNDSKYILFNDSSTCYVNRLDFTIDDINKHFEDVLYNCPPRLYISVEGSHCGYSLEGNGKEIKNIQNKVNIFTSNPDDGNNEEIDECKDLFGEDLLNKIDDIMDVVKIVIPILLIVYGIIDFTKAVFSGNSDNMAKNQKTFFKRILAAILVFIAPIFINLILTLANEVWDNVSPDNCISDIE